jgi:hypothetical protein
MDGSEEGLDMKHGLGTGCYQTSDDFGYTTVRARQFLLCIGEHVVTGLGLASLDKVQVGISGLD